MTALMTAQAAGQAPTPASVDHGDGNPISYTCHMAVLHWGLMGQQHTHQQANAIVTTYAKKNCLHCKGQGLTGHQTIRHPVYGGDFCPEATVVGSADALSRSAQVGDILITGDKSRPAHSMVVVQANPGGAVMINGFNNTGTLGVGTYMQYDGTQRDVTAPALWKADGRFGVGEGMPLFRLAYDAFARRIRVLKFACG